MLTNHNNSSFLIKCITKYLIKCVSTFTALCLFAFSTLSFAAAPATHVVLAEKWINQHEHYDAAQKQAFYLGTLFPDIRYMGEVSRGDTHEKGVTLQLLLEQQSPFLKGKRLHAFVDVKREELVGKWRIYERIKTVPGQRFRATFLKFLEDEILFQKKRVPKITAYFNKVLPEELEQKVSKVSLENWHQNQKMAVSQPPSMYLAKRGAENLSFAGIPPHLLTAWSHSLKVLSKKKEMQNYVDHLLSEFDKIYKDQK